MKKTAHITYHGTPACEHQYPASPVFQKLCEYPSVVEAETAAKEMRKKARRGTVKVVVGDCPAFQAWADSLPKLKEVTHA